MGAEAEATDADMVLDVGAGAGRWGSGDEAGMIMGKDTMGLGDGGPAGGGSEMGGAAAEESMARGGGASSRGMPEEITDRRGVDAGVGAGSTLEVR